MGRPPGRRQGLPAELVTRLRELLRQHQGRAAQPTVCIIDSQMVKAHDTVGKATSGYRQFRSHDLPGHRHTGS